MTRDELIAAMQVTAAQKPRAITVPRWGTIFVRAQTTSEADALAEVSEANGKERLARGAAGVMCDETGKLLFDPSNDADITLLSKQPWALLNKVLEEASKVMGEDEKGN